MSSVDENIVREYFEQNGFLVRQLRKYRVQSRKKRRDEEIDLLVFNPSYSTPSRRPDFMLFSSELRYIHRAVVVVKGWHTLRFTPSMLRSSPEIFRFLEKQVVKQISALFRSASKGEEDDLDHHAHPRTAKGPKKIEWKNSVERQPCRDPQDEGGQKGDEEIDRWPVAIANHNGRCNNNSKLHQNAR